MKNHEFIIFMLGVLAASATLQALTEIARKTWFFQVLFFFAIGTQISTQGMQFSNAVLSRKELDRKSAFVTYAYTEDDKVLLNTVAADEPYLIGYRNFRDAALHRKEGKLQEADQELKVARQKFEEAISKAQYFAQSHYLIAHMIRNQPDADWSEVEKHLAEAIKYDDKYSAAYYALAIVKLHGDQKSAALDNLTNATSFGTIECFDINNPYEVDKVWKRIASEPRFIGLQNDCKRRYPEILKDDFKPPQTQN